MSPRPGTAVSSAAVSVPTDGPGRGGRGRRARRARTSSRRPPRTYGPPPWTTSSRRLVERTEEIAQLISAENGKPIKWARGEVGRAVSVFRFAAEEARRFNGGEAQRLDTDAGRHRPPRPHPPLPARARPRHRALQLPAQPVRPQGRPGASPSAPRSSSSPPRPPRCPALILGELLAETDLPAGSWSRAAGAQRPDARPGPGRAAAGHLLHRLRHRSATSIMDVGAAQARHPGARRQRRGGRAGRLRRPRRTSTGRRSRIATFSNYQGGQSCISVQRVIADASVYDRLMPKVVAAVEAQVTGDPSDAGDRRRPAGQRGRRQARRVLGRRGASHAGAKLLTGGKRDGATYAPTVLADVPADVAVACEEVFGPVLSFRRWTARPRRSRPSTTPSTACRRVCSRTTCRPPSAPTARWRSAAWSSVTCPSYRADQMPYGGAKQSGVGPRGRPLRDGGLHLRARDGAHRPGAVASRALSRTHNGREPPASRAAPSRWEE